MVSVNYMDTDSLCPLFLSLDGASSSCTESTPLQTFQDHIPESSHVAFVFQYISVSSATPSVSANTFFQWLYLLLIIYILLEDTADS